MYVGIDLVEAGRVEKIVNKYREHFCGLFVAPQELDQLGSTTYNIAVLFAIKEAIAKALGVGYIYLSQEGIDPRDILISVDQKNKNYKVALKGEARQIANKLKIDQWYCSTSITQKEIVAVVIGQIKCVNI